MTATNPETIQTAQKGNRKAVLYRMVMKNHICPFGLKAKYLLQREGYKVEDHWLTTREETDAFKAEHHVKTTPQTFIGGDRVGGYDDLRHHLDLDVKSEDATTYAPVIAIFSMAALMALAVTWYLPVGIMSLATLQAFIAIAMCLLGLQKLRDLTGFSNGFLGYDLLAQKYVPYAYMYPFLEAGAGILMLAGIATWLSAPIAALIGTIGAVSVIKAVYIDKRELKCACVGGGSNVPLGFVSLTENLMMMGMGFALLFTLLV